MTEIQKQIYDVQQNPEKAKLSPEEIKNIKDAAKLTLSLQELIEGGVSIHDKINNIKEEVASSMENELWRIFGIPREKMAILHNSDNQSLAWALSSIS